MSLPAEETLDLAQAAPRRLLGGPRQLTDLPGPDRRQMVAGSVPTAAQQTARRRPRCVPSDICRDTRQTGKAVKGNGTQTPWRFQGSGVGNWKSEERARFKDGSFFEERFYLCWEDILRSGQLEVYLKQTLSSNLDEISTKIDTYISHFSN